MHFQQIAPNLHISDSPDFGDYNHQIVHDLLRSVDINFSDALKIAPFTSKACYIHYRKDHPMICYSPFLKGNFIHLHINKSQWYKWVYQFAHEYCHHLIDGEMTGEVSGLLWFEETICELSSMYHLHIIGRQWELSNDPIKFQYSSLFQDYLGALQSESSELSPIPHPGWLESWDSLLSQPILHRDHYNAIAAGMLPLFLENPSLWKIILHIGDSRKWNSLQELFVHFFDNAEPDYIDSLRKLHDLFFL